MISSVGAVVNKVKEKSELNNVKITTVTKPFSENLEEIKNLFVKGGNLIKDKFTPKKSNQNKTLNYNNKTPENKSNNIKSIFSSSKNNKTDYDERCKTEEKPNSRKIEIEDGEGEFNKVYEIDEEEEEEEDNDDNKKYLNNNQLKEENPSNNSNNTIISSNKDNANNQVKLNLQSKFSLQTEDYNIDNKEMVFDNFRNDECEDEEDNIHIMYLEGQNIDISEGKIKYFPYKKITKKSVFNIFSKSEYIEEIRFCFMEESYIYGVEDKVVDKHDNQMRKIDLIIDVRLIYRVLAYVRIK